MSLLTRILQRRSENDDESVRLQAAKLRAKPELCLLLDALPHPLLILNGQRQIVFANRCLLELIGCAEADVICGLRPGDVLDCEHAWADGDGCGLTESCQACGASRAIHLAQHGVETVQECRIVQNGGAALDLRATTTPLRLEGELFTLLALTDISHEKRRRALERVFFHDLLNLTGGLLGSAELLAHVPPEEVPELSVSIARMVRELADEIRSHRDLALAEADDLKVQWEPVHSREALAAAVESARTLDAGRDRSINLHSATADVVFPCDRLLLARVLGNLLKNALEASPPGGLVTAGCHADEEQVQLWVHNDGAMPRDVRLQVFQRSFSTKGPGRGLGTYSIKLLTERYLGGRATFTSAPETGTVFTVSYRRTR